MTPFYFGQETAAFFTGWLPKTVAMDILLVDDHALFRTGLRLLLASLWPDMVIFEASAVEQALAIAREHPNLRLCLLDLDLRQDQGLPAISEIKLAAPNVAVVVVSATDDKDTVRSCIMAGAMSYIAKSAPPAVLTQALTRVLQGDVFLPPTVFAEASATPTKVLVLTPRQRDVLSGLNRGLPSKLIARELGISEYTVKEYIADLFRLLGVRNRTEAVIEASRLSLHTQA